MSTRFLWRSLTHYWRTNLAVVFGVGAAVTVLSGALLVGDSVRGSLRDLVLRRIGATDLLLHSTGFFRTGLAGDLRSDPEFAASFAGVAPMIAVQGLATDQMSGQRASRVQVYGVDDRFWTFHGAPPRGPAARQVLLSAALAEAIGATVGSAVILRVQQPSAMPLEYMHGRRDDLGRSFRLTVGAVLPAGDLGEFSLQPQQGDVLAAFVPLAELQRELALGDRLNALLVSAAAGPPADPGTLASLVRRHATIEDVGLRLRVLDRPQAVALEADAGLIDDMRAADARAAAEAMGASARPVLTYLVNTIRRGPREIPYSLVSALDLGALAPGVAPAPEGPAPIVLNDWAARDLGAAPGDVLTLDYFVWQDPGRLVTEQAEVRVARVVPLAGAAADPDLAPEYPGITGSDDLQDWDPPFPLDLSRVRPIDEQYWDEHRATPKAFIPLETGDRLWRSRYGALTAIRIDPPAGLSLQDARDAWAARLSAAIDPLAAGLSIAAVRADGLAASQGATNFGEYFVYFSFFLVVAALTLAALFFKLGVEQRVREVGLLRAVGFSPGAVRRHFAAEALVLSIAGSVLGVGGALAYGGLMMTGLRTIWVDAVGTEALSLHVSAASLLLGAAGGIVSALACIVWTLRALARVSERSLLAGQLPHGRDAPTFQARASTPAVWSAACLALGLLLVALAAADLVDPAAGFFGAGASLLVACLAALAAYLARAPRTPISGRGWWPVSRLGWRSAAYRPARSVLSVSVMAAAAFILVSVDAFRRTGHVDPADPRGGTGGYTLAVDLLLPFAHDPLGPDGRALIGLSEGDDVLISPFRVLPGDDASCLNLYRPQRPRIIAPKDEFLEDGRFTFRDSLAYSPAELENPWRLLLREADESEPIPVVADANSMTYVLHKRLGDIIEIDRVGDLPLRLRLVAALSDSMLQGELVMSERNFLKAFPGQEGYQLLLVGAPAGRTGEVAATIEDRLADFGADATPAADRLAGFHRVENTYLSTFQTLGGLGLLLGTVGLGAVLLRNVLERRRELALLGAVGYGPGRLLGMIVAESALLLACGLAAGAACAALAIMPAAVERGGALPSGTGLWMLLLAVFTTGLMSAIIATRAAIQARLLEALRSE
jgi:ABC-type lipoprotein release transport system permease subunit